jgi:hypothetical protein
MATAKAKKTTPAKKPSAKEAPKGAVAVKGAGKGAKAADAKGAKADDKGAKRKLGLRGAAPWAARHAAKHAAEARARAAEPPLPGSARATIRVPTGAEDIKQKIGDLHNALVQIKAFRKNLNKSFWDIGHILKDIQARRLYEAKGYGTFEAFLEREIDLGKTTALRLVRVVTTFLKEAAQEHGMDRVMNALSALENVVEGDTHHGKGSKNIPPPPVSTPALPLKPPGR